MTLEEIWAFIAAILAILALAHFVLTIGREKRRAAEGKSRFGVFRLLLAAVAAGVALFSVGCSLFFLANLSVSGPQQYLDWTVVLIIGGIPFAIAALIWWLSMRRGFRLLLAAVAAGVALFSGVCFWLYLRNGPQTVFLIIGGIPIAITPLIWWLSMRRGKALGKDGAE